MAQPTLAYSTTTVTLPHPSAAQAPTRTHGERGGERRTVTGALRRWIGPHWYEYSLSFEDAPQTTYDTIVSLVRLAAAANAFPTFTWSGGPWPSATSGVTVSAAVGEMRPSASGSFSLCDFALALVETSPRT